MPRHPRALRAALALGVALGVLGVVLAGGDEGGRRLHAQEKADLVAFLSTL